MSDEDMVVLSGLPAWPGGHTSFCLWSISIPEDGLFGGCRPGQAKREPGPIPGRRIALPDPCPHAAARCWLRSTAMPRWEWEGYVESALGSLEIRECAAL